MDEPIAMTSTRAPKKPAILVFDGRGSVKRVDGNVIPEAPPKGFVLVAGNSREPEYRVWLKTEVGVFHGDAMTMPSARARCTVADDKALVVLRIVRPNAEPEDVGRQFLSILVEKDRVTIASELNVVDFAAIDQWQQSRHAPVSPADFVARLGLRAADRIEPLIERLGDRLDDIEERIMVEDASDARTSLSRLRRNLINFRRLIWPQRDVLNTLEIEDLSFFSNRDRVRLREAAARTARLSDELQALSERAVLVHEQLLDTRAEQMNQSMLVLAAVTTLFMPLTLITGLLGMNVEGIPWAGQPWAFAGVCVTLVAIGVATVFFLHAKKWL